MRKAGIHARLLLAAFLLICAATFALDYVGVLITRQFMKKRFQDSVTFLARYLALNSEVGVLIGDKSGLRILSLNLLGEEDVARVVIMDNHNNILVDQSKEVKGELSSVETPVLFKRASDENVLFTENRTIFGNMEIPGVDYIGKVKIYYSTHGIDRLMIEITKQYLWVSFALILVSSGVFHFISRSIVNEVRELAITFRQIGRGDTELRAIPRNIPETRDLAISFNSMLDSLEKSQKDLKRVNDEMVRQKSLAEVGKFSLIVAHEVKNPIGIIKSSLDILKRDVGISSDNLMVAYIEDEILRLNKLIEDFLLFARPGKPNFKMVNLTPLVEEVLRRFEIQTINSTIAFELELPEDKFQIMADGDLLIRAVSNIIKNACEANKYTGIVWVSVNRKNNTWTLCVEDQGGGIPTGNREKIFEPFFTTKSKGTGLGLAFVNQIIQIHNGTISVEDGAKGGALFTVTLPGKGHV